MSLPMLLAAAKSWTYWIAPSLLIVIVLAMVGFAAVYYRKVVGPKYQLMLHQQGQAITQLRRPTSIGPSVGAERSRPLAA